MAAGDQPPSKGNGGGNGKRATFAVEGTGFTDLEAGEATDTSRSSSPDVPGTPGVAATAASLRKNLSFSSLKKLEMKDVGRKVWRQSSSGAPIRRPHTLEQLVVFSLRGGLRSFGLGYSLRSGIALVFALFRLLSAKNNSKRLSIAPGLIKKALFGEDAVRFGGMLGVFTAVWKFVDSGLRIYNPGPRGRGKTEAWHASVAGALSALGLLAEKKGRRVSLAQQLFVRGLQGGWNYASWRKWVHVPNGDVLLFGLANGWIMYCWLCRPETMSPGYHRWITNAGRIPPPSMDVNYTLVRDGTFTIPDARRVLSWPKITPSNKQKVETMMQLGGQGHYGGRRIAPCEVVHPWVDTCSWTLVDRFQATFRWMLPVYAGLHFIPPILLRQKAFRKDPSTFLTRSALGTIRSSSFLATFVVIFQGHHCLAANMHEWRDKAFVPSIAVRALTHRYWNWVMGVSTCLSLFIEEKKRRGELAMYCLPKALESIWSILRQRAYVPLVPGGTLLLGSTGLATIMTLFKHHPARLSGLVRALLFQIVGPV